MKKTADIGTLNGPLLVFGGVYSNLQALETLKDIASNKGIDSSNIICTGDIVGYCAQPEECLQLIKDWGINTVLGNVEIQLRDNKDVCGCNFEEGTRCDVLSKSWYPYAKTMVSEDSRNWLSSLPDFIRFTYADKKVMVLHGGIKDVSQFIFRSTFWDDKKTVFEEAESEVILAGHCGLPFNHSQESLHWLNAGVIGMPANDGTPRVWYMILSDQKGFSFKHISFDYNYDLTKKLMIIEGLPTSYSKTLTSGIWDNCDILPEEETSIQGKRLSLC